MKRRLRDSDTWHKITRYWVEVLALVADVAAIVAIGAAFLTQYGKSLISIYVLGLLTILWILLIVQEYRYARKSSYAEAPRYIHAVLHFLRDTSDEVSSMSEAELKRNLERALGKFAIAFGLVTRTGCRASIKVLSLAPNAPAHWRSQKDGVRWLLVRTLARDPTSAAEPRQETAEWLTENTAFHEVFVNPAQRCFFENDLKKRISKGQWRSSHLPDGYDNKTDDWPLAYKSTIVWPIRFWKDLADQPEMAGYLCIDSPSRNVFVKRYDFELGAAIADALYMYLPRLKDGLHRRVDT